MISIMKFFVALIVAFAAMPPLYAGETEWLEVMPSVSLRLVSSDVITQDGTVWMGLEIDMPADTKTYWRVPGESGIPLKIDWAGSQGVEDIAISWPYPLREVADHYLDHAYYGRVLIPFEARIEGDTGHLAAEITLGICADVCVPVSARLDLPIRDSERSANMVRIRQALARVPLAYDNDAQFGNAVFDMDQRAIILSGVPEEIDPQTMIAELEGAMLVFDVPQLTEDGEALKFTLLGRPDPAMFQDGSARFTFDTNDGPFEIVRPLGMR